MNDLPDPTCQDCKALYMEAQDENGSIRGQCRLRPELGEVPATMSYCYLFRVRDARAGMVKNVDTSRATGQGRQPSRRREPAHSPQRPTLRDPVTGETDGEIAMDRDGLKQVLRELLEEETLYGYPEMGRRWQGGSIVIKPGTEETQEKSMPIDTLFHKIVMVRDRLRVLEAKINASQRLDEGEKVELQGYITKCYGSLTTFNTLFQDKADHFSSK